MSDKKENTISMKELQEVTQTKKTFGKRTDTLNEIKEEIKELKPHKKQLQFIEAKQFMRIWLSARRTGKTTCIILDDLKTIDKVAPQKRGHLLKVYPTAEKGVELIYDELCAALDNMKYLRNESRYFGRIETKNNCVIKFLGLRNEKDAEKIRGFKNKSICFDECQSMISDNLEYAIASPSIQSLSDFMPDGSHLNMFGTPPPSIGHIFAKKFLEKNPEHFKITALMEDNPHYSKESREMVKKELKNFLSIKQETPDDQIIHPVYRREILGHCINDPARIIFNKEFFEDYLYNTRPPLRDENKYYMGVYISQKPEIAISLNLTSTKHPKVYCIHEEKLKYRSIQQIPFLINKIKKKYDINQSMLSVFFHYADESQGISDELTSYYDSNINISEDFEEKKYMQLAEKININLLLKNFKIKKDSLFLKGWDEVFWNEKRKDIDETAGCSPIVYSQMLVWAEINNKFIRKKTDDIIDPVEQYRKNLEEMKVKS